MTGSLASTAATTKPPEGGFSISNSTIAHRVAGFSPEGVGESEMQRSPKGRVSPQAAHRAIRHAGGGMARLSKTPVLVLTTEDATTKPVAVAVRTAAAQRRGRRGYRNQTQGDESEQGSRG
jgi:hypothetical protein